MQTHIQERINKIQKGEVPEGYQKTKVGIIPDNWKLSPIQELLDQKVIKGHLYGNHGALYPRSHEFSTSGIPYVTANDFINGYVNFDRCKFLPIEKANQFKKGVAKTGDVLFAHNATVGPVALLKTDFDLVILSTTATYFRCDNKNLLNKFLVHALQANFFVKQYTAVMSQSTRNQVPITTQRTFKLSLPPFIEQQKIAEILSAWDDAIRLQQELIEQKKTQKRGLMQLLLSGKIRVTEMGKLSPETLKKRVADIQQGIVPEGYQKTKLGIIPGEWKVKRIFEITEYVDYRGKTPQKSSAGVYLITARNIKKGFIDYEISKEYISRTKYNEVMSRGIPQKGDVLITTEAPLGNVAQIDRTDVALAQRVIKYRGMRGLLDNTYLKYYLLSDNFQKELELESTGSTVKGVKGSRLHKLSAVLPSLQEQQKITDILTTADKEIELLETELEQLQSQKKGLMQVLLTGKIRVHEQPEGVNHHETDCLS